VNISSVKRGDVVEADVKGRRFLAKITGDRSPLGHLPIKPLDDRVTYRSVTARQVVGIWHANKATRARQEGDPFAD
jgi:hypothetical protein